MASSLHSLAPFQQPAYFTDTKSHELVAGTIVQGETTTSYTYFNWMIPPAVDITNEDNPLKVSASQMNLFARISSENKTAGSMTLSIREDCFEEKTKRFLYIERMQNTQRKSFQKIGTAFIEAAISYSLSLGLKGRVKLFASEEAHLFYIKCGFVPSEKEYKYPRCVIITRYLSFVSSESSKADNDPTKHCLYREAREILAQEHGKTKKEIDAVFIQKHWYWDQKYPLTTSKEYGAFIHEAKKTIKKSEEEHIYPVFHPLSMHLPKKALATWKKIIATPIDHLKERNALHLQLREESFSFYT